jgi:plastocyanin
MRIYDLRRAFTLLAAIDMRIKLVLPALVIACGIGTWGCSGSPLPSSPSALDSQNTASSATGRFRALDDPVMPTPTPIQVLINIVGSFGSTAFMPNPTAANMGDQIVFTNTDLVMHHIVLDDGTDLGEVQPGQSSAPMSLMTPTAGYHCTIHPTMVGSINGTLPAANPAPADPYYPPGDDYGGGYGGGYY